MPTTFNYSGKPAFMYDQETDVWLQLGGAIDTSAGYTWTGVHAFSSDASFADSLTSREGLNNFLNPAARDAAITSPVHGSVAFVRQDAGGNTINQWQYYNGSSWVANDGDISGVTASTGLSGGGTAGTITLSVDTAVVATTNNTLTMSNKTLTSPVVTGLTLNDSSIVFEGSSADDYETTLTVTNPTADRTITIPNITGTLITTGDTGTVTNTMLVNSGITINGSSVSLGGTVTIQGESFDPFMLMGA